MKTCEDCGTQHRRPTAKQALFVRHYLKLLNATKAAIEAGYSKKNAAQIAFQQLQKATVQCLIQQQGFERQERLELDADDVMRRAWEIQGFDIAEIVGEDGELLPRSEWPEAARRVFGIDGRMPDRLKALEMVGRSMGMFTDVVKVDGLEDLEERLRSRRQQIQGRA